MYCRFVEFLMQVIFRASHLCKRPLASLCPSLGITRWKISILSFFFGLFFPLLSSVNHANKVITDSLFLNIKLESTWSTLNQEYRICFLSCGTVDRLTLALFTLKLVQKNTFRNTFSLLIQWNCWCTYPFEIHFLPCETVTAYL